MAIVPVPDDAELLIDSLEPDRPAQVNRSAWTGSSKTVGLPGASLWYASAHVRNANTDRKKRYWRAFKLALRGAQNSFRLRVTRCDQRAGPNPTVAAGAGAGNTLPLSGFPANATNLETGEYLTVTLPSGHERCVVLMAPLISNASGNATATFEPDLGEIPAVGSTVETKRPWVLVKQTQSRTGWSNDNGRSGFTFDLVEAK